MRRRAWRLSGLAVLTVAFAVAAVAGAGQQNVVVGPVSAQSGKAFSGQVATFKHVGKEDSNRDETAVIDWGDGTPATTGTVVPDACEFCENTTSRVNGTHTYAAPGTYTVKVTVDDPFSAPVQGSGSASVTASATPTPAPTGTATPVPTASPSPTATPPPPPPGCVDTVKVGLVAAVVVQTTGAGETVCFVKESYTYATSSGAKQANRYVTALSQQVYLNGFLVAPDQGSRVVLEPATRRIYLRAGGDPSAKSHGGKPGTAFYLGLVSRPPRAADLVEGAALGSVILSRNDAAPFDVKVPSAGGADSVEFAVIETGGEADEAIPAGGFPLAGAARVRAFADGRSEMRVLVALPEELGGLTAELRLRADNANGLDLTSLENLEIGPLTIMVPPGLEVVEFTNLQLRLEYGPTGVLNVWRGTGELRLPSPLPTEPITAITGPLVADVGFTAGDLTEGGLCAGPFDSPIAVGTGIYLYRLGFEFMDTEQGLTFAGDCIGLFGGGSFAGQPLIDMPDGNIALTFGRGDAPAVAVDVSTGAVKVIGLTGGTADAHLDSDGQFRFRGAYDFSIFNGLGYKGNVAGWVDAPKQKFSFAAEGDAYLPYKTSARGVLSSTGIAVCGSIDLWLTSVDVGFGYRWGDTLPSIMAPSCDFGPYAAAATRTVATTPFERLAAPSLRQTQAPPTPSTNVRELDLSGKREAVTFAVRGVNGPPVVRVTIAETGETIVANGTDPAQPQVEGPFYVTRDEGTSTRHIAIAHPPAGTYRFEPIGELSVVKRIDKAELLVKPDIQVKKVTPAGKTKGPMDVADFVVPYLVDPLGFETYTFIESGNGVNAVIKTLTGKELLAGAGQARSAGRVRGELRFEPADGPAGRRSIKVLVTTAGLPRTTLTVGSYVAPPRAHPGRPRKLRLRRRGSRVVVAFKPAAGAVRHRIEVALSDGRRLLFLRGRGARRLTLKGVRPATRGRVSVVGLDRSNEAGPAAQARLSSQ